MKIKQIYEMKTTANFEQKREREMEIQSTNEML